MKKCVPDKCNASCCRYAAIVIDAPTSKSDFEDIRWLISHHNVAVYKDLEDDWVLEFESPCKFLKDNRCSDYENRPYICRDYEADTCTQNRRGKDSKILFEEPAQVEAFVAKRWQKKKPAAKRPASKNL
ncbi:MAG TPA: YkgJ family cysteine cluster protein [bacterium]|nr:MAG: Flagellin N-methylase [bacterium ADurb.Bin236]HOY63784.1 YkgJ family cysteine cluster protein [bacterium]HPI77107.1 YkgJ family cysteine cluster protein [bacterium]HPN94239.1 YkgJ family cysteine cluster protein [bacterium]